MAATPASARGGAADQSVIIRDATDDDFSAIEAIYAHEVLRTLSNFEEVPPAADELLSRRDAVLRAGLPYLTAELDGAVVGYSYAALYRTRTAYRFTLEDSVYVARAMHRRGVGRALLDALIARCEGGPWRQMVAVIGHGDNAASIALHKGLGFRMVGTFEAVGYKLGDWVDTVLMQRPLGPGAETPPDDRPQHR